MKKLDLSAVTDSAQFFTKQGTFNFLQLAYQEGFSGVVESLIGDSYSPSLVYILSGCVPTIIGGNYSYTAGYAYYNGEFFQISASSLTPTTGQIPLFVLNTISYTINADPVTFSDHTTHNIHTIRTLAIVAGPMGGSGITNYISDVSNAQNLVSLSALNSSAVKTTGDQTIGGLKTFSFSPIVPTPTADYQVSTKKYVDDKLSNAILYAGNAAIGDVVQGDGTTVTVNFPTVGTSNYIVAGSLVGAGTVLNDSTLSWAIRSKTATSFSIHLQEWSNLLQNVSFDYALISL